MSQDAGSELGRLLSERDRLIAAGADPSDLETPLAPTTPDPLRAALEDLRTLSDDASAGPWQWLDGGGEHQDELQDGHGEMVASGFREDIVMDGKPLNRDGSFAAAAANYVRAALAADIARLAPCWFCKQKFVVDALIAGYDTWDESRLACLACNERMQGNWRPRPEHRYPSDLCECGHVESHHHWTCGDCGHVPPYDAQLADGGVSFTAPAQGPDVPRTYRP